MPLGLSDAAKNYVGPVVWTAVIEDPAAANADDPVGHRYFAEGALSLPGFYVPFDMYLPYLRIDTPPTISRSMASDLAEISLLNSDLVVGSLMGDRDWDGLTCVLSEYLFGIGTLVERFRGVLVSSVSAQTDGAVKFRVVSTLDAAQIDAQSRIWSTRCTLRFSKPQCGYVNEASEMDVVEMLGERTADAFDAENISDSTLGMTPDEHKNRYVVITAGTGKGQKRRILTNDATNLEVVNKFSVVPDGTSKFKVFIFVAGAPKFLFTATTSLVEAACDVFSARAVGYSGLALPVNAHAGEVVAIMSSFSVVQKRKIVSNTATTITIATDEKDFDPPLGGGEVFRVLFAKCPKDFAQSCEMRARAHRFNGFPTLNPSIGHFVPPPSGGDVGGGGNYNDDSGGQFGSWQPIWPGE